MIYATKWCKRENASSESVLDDWKQSIKDIVTKIIARFSKHSCAQPSKILEDDHVIYYLHEFQKQFVMVPADKASNNIIIVCTKYYIQTLIDELGVFSDTASKTYAYDNTTLDIIVKLHLEKITLLQIEVSEKQQDLPKLYGIPKMHKTPYKSRFIDGSKYCTTKAVSILLTICFQCIKIKKEIYCSTFFNNSGINRMWILKNSPTLLSTIKSNNLKKVDYIRNWDFSTPYTTSPHDQLKSRICRLIRKAFCHGNNNYINVSCN